MNGDLDWMVLKVFVGLKGMTGGPIWMLVACLPVAKDIMNPRLLKVLHRPQSELLFNYTRNYMERYKTFFFLQEPW